MKSPPSPRIERLEWGSVVIEGGMRYKDVKLFPGGAREWDWRETGTRHSPGIQLADVKELIQHGAMVVILSRGQLGRLKVAPGTRRALEELGVAYHILDTKVAVQMYGRLRDQVATGALIHSTC